MLWGIDVYWRQLKLVVLAWSSVEVEVLVGDGGPLFENDKHHDGDIHCRHVQRGPDGKRDRGGGNYASMLLENVAKFCQNKQWGGDLAGILVPERLGVVLKMPSAKDMLSRKRADAQLDQLTNYSGRYGLNHFHDNRHSLVKERQGGVRKSSYVGQAASQTLWSTR